MILPPDIPAQLLSFSRWGVCTLFLLFMNRRLSGWKFWLSAALGVGAFALLHFAADLLPENFWLFNLVGGVLLMFAYLLSISKQPPLHCACRAILAFLSSEAISSLVWQLLVFFQADNAFFQTFVGQAIVAVLVYAVCFVVLFFVEKRYATMQEEYGWKDLAVQMATASLVIALGNLSFWTATDTPISGKYPTEILYIRTLVYLCGVLLLFAQRELTMVVRARSEAALMQATLEQQYQQFCLSKETIENVNRKYHDLKHCIFAIRAETDPEKRVAYLDSVEESIKTYEAQNKTGNPVLDVLLTTKSTYCIEQKINFTCVADGALLSFMNVVDLCSLFGNALDNAIESVLSLPEEKRIIKLAVFSQNDFLLIQVSNYFAGALKYENGKLVTSKKDKLNHGYGLKSMRQVAEKYGGSLHVTAEKNWFSLSVIIPLASKTD